MSLAKTNRRIAERYLRDIDEAHGRIVTIRLGEGSADDVHDLRMLADLCLVAGAGRRLPTIDADVVDSVYHELAAVAV